MNPLLTQINLDVNELYRAGGIVAVVIVGAVVAGILLIRSELVKSRAALENAQGSSAALEANAKTQTMVSDLAMKTSEQNADMNAKLLTMSEALGEAKSKIAVLEEREKLHEEKFKNLNMRLEEKSQIITLRDKTIAQLRVEIKTLKDQRDRLQIDNDGKDVEIQKLTDRIRTLEIRLQLAESAERHAPTQPIPYLSPDGDIIPVSPTTLQDVTTPSENTEQTDDSIDGAA